MSSSLQSPDATIIRNWTEQMTETFESVFPPSDGICRVYDYSEDGFERLWGDDSLRASEGNWSGWPARSGADGLDPDSDPYPSNMDAWLECGPFDLSDADDAYMQFRLWLDIPDSDGDEIFFGVSADGVNYQGYAVSGQDPQWAPWKVWYSSFAGDSSVWLLWRFVSDGDTDVGPGVWLDDIHVWAYDEPSKDCDGLDPGSKALNIPAYVWHAGSEIPFFSDPVEMDLVEASGASWARLEFIAKEYGAVNVRDYDMMVDSLCAQDIATLAIVDYRTLTRQDWNTNQEAYRNEFTRTLQSLVSHYKNRIDYWEIWNEQDHPEPGQRFDSPGDYADLLEASYETIEAVDPEAKVIYGGTYGIQDDSYGYLQLVYDDWGAGESYLDLLGLHPYFFDPPGPEDYILDPERYLHYDDDPLYTTTLDKFLRTMSERGVYLSACGATLMKRVLNVELRFKAPALALCLGLLGLLLMVTAACHSSPPSVPTVIDTVKLPSLPNRVAVDPANGVAYILHKNTDSVSILQGTHLSTTVQLASPKLRGTYDSIIVQPSTGRAYVFGSLGRPIRVIALDGTLATIQDPSFWFRDAIVNPATGYIYATNLWDREENGKAIGGSVLVITGTQVIARVPVGRLPVSLAVNPANGLVYVGDHPETSKDNHQLITVISGTQVIATSDMGQVPGRGGGVSQIIVEGWTSPDWLRYERQKA